MSGSSKKSALSLPLVIGIGNPLMGDDNAGPSVISLLEKSACRAELLTLRSSGYGLLTYISKRKKVIIVDAASFGGKPGDIKKIQWSKALSAKKPRALSLHDADLFAVIENAHALGIAPKSVIFYCVQLGQMGPGEKLSSAVDDGVRKTALLIERELKNA